ncbi:MAG: hypothetical protein Q9175_007238, partial [Cornicularia normoerica]
PSPTKMIFVRHGRANGRPIFRALPADWLSTTVEGGGHLMDWETATSTKVVKAISK